MKQVQCTQLKFQDLEKVPPSREKNEYYILSFASLRNLKKTIKAKT